MIKSNIRIGRREIGNGLMPYIIVEMACAHNGSFEEAKALIDAAVLAKADAVQLQFFVADETVTPNHEAYNIVKQIEFNERQWRELVNYAKNENIDVWACTYDVPSVRLAIDTECQGIKLNSADLSNPDVLRAVAESGIPFTLGTGASTMKEIESGLETIIKHGGSEVVLMHGVQNFPTATDDLHINRLDLLARHFPNIAIGYADHTDGDNRFASIVDLLAVAKGVAVIEKHITLDRSSKGIDYQAALEPEEYVDFVSRIRLGYKALGSSSERPFSESDMKYRKFQKKSVVAARSMQSGTLLTRNDVKFIRNTEPGLAPNQFGLIEGKTLNTDMIEFENITEEHVNN